MSCAPMGDSGANTSPQQARAPFADLIGKSVGGVRVEFGLATRIYVAAGATDIRLGFNGLDGLIRDRLECDPESGQVSPLTYARRNRLKLVFLE